MSIDPMRRFAMFVAILLLTMPASADSPDHAIVDERGELGERDPYTGYYITPPEVDMWWIDLTPHNGVLEVSIRVEDLSHRTFAPDFQGFSFIVAWTTVSADGAHWESMGVVANHYTFDGRESQELYELHTSSRVVPVEGLYDWKNNTVHVYVPLSFFHSGDSLEGGVAWSRTDTQNIVGIYVGAVVFGDRAPNTGWGTSATRIP